MFVLCPHCHFLVGIDPRTGKPPAACPKCGGVVVEPLPDVPTDGMHTEEVPVPLAPFAPVELPSVLPTLPDVDPVAEQGQDEQVQAPVPAAPITAEVVAAPAPASSAAIETAATPGPKPRWWSRRQTEAVVGPASTKTAAATEAPAPPASVATGAVPPASADAHRADAMIAALQGHRRTTRKAAVAPPPSPIQPPPVGDVVEAKVEVEERPPAVQIEGVVATTSAGIDTPAETPTETPAATPTRKRARRTLAPTAADTVPPGTTATSIESVAAASTPVVVMPADSVPSDSMPIGSMSVGMPAPSHPLRRRTDIDPNAIPEPVAGNAPPHPLRRRTDAPSFTRPRVRANSASRIGWRSLVAAGGLSLLLVLQLLLAQRDTLAASPRWRSTITTVCAALRCSLPPWHEPAAFTMLSRDVRPHPGAPGTLLINASFRNDARWPQPWPRLLLTLSDLDGRMVGARSFAADEYLGATPTQSALAPGQTAAVTLSVVEPAPNIVAFTFDFR